MEFNGAYAREFTNRKSLSFSMKSSSINNVTGVASFGVSGEGQTLELEFDKGKIKDFNDVYAGSYDVSSVFEVSGDISEDYYNYEIDGVSIARGINKNSFKIEKFFINTTDCTFTTNLYIYGDSVDHVISAPTTINSGETFNISISNNSSDGIIYIYSAKFVGGKSPYYYINPSFTKEIDYGQSINLSVTSSTAGGTGNHQLDLELHTNVGKITKTIPITVSEPDVIDVLTTLEEQVTSFSQNFVFDTVNGSGERMFKYNSFAQGAYQSIEKLSLEYSGGNVGSYYRVSGVNITNAGNGYVIGGQGAVTVSFGAGQGNDVQTEGEVTMDGVSVSSVDITNSGVYFGSSPVVTFSGDFADPNDPNNVDATGVAMVEGYQKEFTEIWDVATGILPDNASLSSFKEYQLTGNQGEVQYDYENFGPGTYETPESYVIGSGQDLYIKITNKSFYDFDSSEAKLKIESKLADTQTYRTIEEVSMSGGNQLTS